MKKSDNIFMVHDDREKYDKSQLNAEELVVYESIPDIPQERLTEILLESVIN